MATRQQHDWPAIEGLLPFVRKYGISEAAERLGVAPSSLYSHLRKNGIRPEDYENKKALAADALKEIAELVGK